MSDLLKAVAAPQFGWFYKWTSLGSDGMPDRTIEDGLKQPDRIKISFTANSKEYSASIAPDQARFGPEFFLAMTLPDFKHQVVNRLPANKKEDGPTLFPLLEQCLQEVALTEWRNVVSTRCPTEEGKTYENFLECIRDYLEALAGFPNVGDQLIRWLRTVKKPALMPVHDFMRRRVQLMTYLEDGLLRRTMALPGDQEKIEQVFFSVPLRHRQKYAETHKSLPTEVTMLACFFEQCQNADAINGTLKALKREKKQSKATSDRLSDRNKNRDARRNRSRDRNGRRHRDRHYDRRDRDHNDRRARDRNMDRNERNARNDRNKDCKSDRHRDHKDRKHDRNDRDRKNDRPHRAIDDKAKGHHAMHIDAGRRTSRSRSRSFSSYSSSSKRSSSAASRSSSRSRSGENHHLTDQGRNSTLSPRKRAHSYSEENEHRLANDGSVFATFLPPGTSKSKTKEDVPRKTKHQAKRHA